MGFLAAIDVFVEGPIFHFLAVIFPVSCGTVRGCEGCRLDTKSPVLGATSQDATCMLRECLTLPDGGASHDDSRNM